MSQITIRHLDPAAEGAIREMARKQGISLSEATTRLLRKALGLEAGDKRRDLSDLAGTWSADDVGEFERAQDDLRGIDDEVWR